MIRKMKRKHIIGALSAGAYLVAFWHRLILEGKIPFHCDTLIFYFPNWLVGQRLWTEGFYFLWDPFRNLGQPYLASPQNQALYFVRFIGNFLSLLDYMRFFVVFHVLLASFFGFLVGHHFTKSFKSGIVSALGFGFAGPFIMRVVYHADFASIAWLPAQLYFLSILSPIGLGWTLAFQVFAGYPPFLLMSAFMLMLTTFVETGNRNERIYCLLKGFLWGAGLSAIQWVPFLEMMKESARTVLLDSSLSSVSATSLLEVFRGLFLPGFVWNLNPTFINYRTTFYLGPFLFALFLWGVKKGGTVSRRLALISVLGFILSLDEFKPILSGVPFLRIFRFPGNWLVMASAALVLTSAIGLSKIKNKGIQSVWILIIAFDLLIFAWPVRYAYSRVESILPFKSIQELPENLEKQRIQYDENIVRGFPTWDEFNSDYWSILSNCYVPSNGILWGKYEVSSNHALTSRRNLLFREKIISSSNSDFYRSLANINERIVFKDKVPPSISPKITDFSVVRSTGARGRVFFQDMETKPVILEDKPGFCRVEAEGPGSLVFSEIYYPGWKVWLDDNLKELKQAEKIFLSVDVPAGKHEVIFAYCPKSVYSGMFITFLTILFMWLNRRCLQILSWIRRVAKTIQPRHKLEKKRSPYKFS
jgi:hypothetical protein